MEAVKKLEREEEYLLTIKSIKGNGNLKEIIIKSPLSYRIFFIEYNGEYYIVLDIQAKKQNKFPQKYFDTILNRIERNQEEEDG